MTFQIKARTEEEFGTPIHLHQFRHIHATDTATLTPEHAGSIQHGLGHARQSLSEEDYNLANAISAGRKYDETRKALRKEGR